MSILPVRLYTDKILHTAAIPVVDFTGMKALTDSMLSTMEAYKGVGLAAPQFGLGLQIAVCWLEQKTRKIIIINPKIICYTKEVEVAEEGCLSAPNIFLHMKRYKNIEVEAQDETGTVQHYNFTGYDARIFQHEYEHLMGRMITDTIGKL